MHSSSSGSPVVSMACCVLPMACQIVAPRIAFAQDLSIRPNRIVTQGQATLIVDNLYRCPVTVDNYRPSAVGRVTANDGTVITVPAVTVFEKASARKAFDLYNECTLTTPQTTANVSAANVPVVEVDPDGDVITGYVVADNYYELYVNGTLVSVDNVPYTPFNSAIVKFRVKRPYTLTFLLVDWEEHLGLGMEVFRYLFTALQPS